MDELSDRRPDEDDLLSAIRGCSFGSPVELCALGQLARFFVRLLSTSRYALCEFNKEIGQIGSFQNTLLRPWDHILNARLHA